MKPDAIKKMRDVKDAAAKLVNAIRRAGPDEASHYLVSVGLTGAGFSGGVVELFEKQLEAVAGRAE